jgi:hypothetical protein
MRAGCFELLPDVDRPGADGQGGSAGLWVGDVGICDYCAQLTIRGKCRCEEAAAENIRQAEPRPSWVEVRAGNEADAADHSMAVLQVPADVSAPARHVAEVMAFRASIRLALGDTMDFSLHRVAGGRDSIAAELEASGVTLDRKTVARALEELVERGVLHHVGQLGGWIDMHHEGGPMQKVGAYVYALAIRWRQLGDLLPGALRRARNRLACAPDPLRARS